ILGPVPAHCRSYIQLNGDGARRGGILSFDAVISDVSGRPLVVIEDFLMKLVDAHHLGIASAEGTGRDVISSLAELGTRFGIEAQEGASVLEMLLVEGGPSHRIVATTSWDTVESVL